MHGKDNQLVSKNNINPLDNSSYIAALVQRSMIVAILW